jgi:hypothetical protein
VVLAVGPGCGAKKASSSHALDHKGHRLVRISFSGERNAFKMRVDEGPIEKIQNTSFTNVMTSLDFVYGDIVMWEAVRNASGAEQTWPSDLNLWWLTYLSHVRASYYGINSDNIRNFFNSPIYHWYGPPDLPRPLKEASFYKDGKLLGKDTAGLSTMLGDFLKVKNNDTPFILPPRFKRFGNDPFDDQVDNWIGEAGLTNRFAACCWGGRVDDWAKDMDRP